MLEAINRGVEASNGRHCLLVVALTKLGANVPSSVMNRLGVRLAGTAPGAKAAQLQRHVAALITRVVEGKGLTGDTGLRLFISHTKRDALGLQYAQSIRDLLFKENEPIKFFFDAIDIEDAESIQEKIEGALDGSTLLAVRTDGYSASPWCNLEVIEAKRRGRPIVVFDLLNARDERALPGLGNVPHVRLRAGKMSKTALDNALSEVVDAAVVETMRFHYLRRRLEHLRTLGQLPSGATVCARPPEERDLRALAGKAKAKRIIAYPDPPLPLCETKELEKSRVRLVTPLTAMPVELSGKVIGLSVAEVHEDVSPLGISDDHLLAAMDLLARALLSKKATLAYGGDLRPEGFTLFLGGLVKAHNAMARGEFTAIRNYLRWPSTVSEDEQADRVNYLQTILLPPPEGVTVTTVPDDMEGQYLRGLGMTAMRERMTQDIDARIALGGKLTGFSGRYPGILEEVLLCLRAKKPVFVLGGFGGAAGGIAELLRGDAPTILSYETIKARFPEYEERLAYHNAKGAAKPADLDAVLAEVARRGIAGLRNGLRKKENRRLLETQDVDEAAWLILSGLSQLWPPK
ncbi:MAG: TIR domain-containing protein [Rhodospirillaceae bacterium]